MGSAAIPLSVLTLALTIYAASVGADAAAKPTAVEQLLATHGYQQSESVKAIRSYRITNWTVLDDQHVVLTTEPEQDYLITLTSPCQGLAVAPAIGFSSTAGDLTPLDKLVIQGDVVKTQCPIRRINQLKRSGDR
jgi:hypothetical protein